MTCHSYEEAYCEVVDALANGTALEPERLWPILREYRLHECETLLRSLAGAGLIEEAEAEALIRWADEART